MIRRTSDPSSRAGKGGRVAGHAFIALVASVSAITFICGDAPAFQMVPAGDKSCSIVISHEKLIKKLQDKAGDCIASFMSAPVHERIADCVFGPGSVNSECLQKDEITPSAPPAVIAGAEWNDNPPFYLTAASISECRSAIDNELVIQLPKEYLCWALLLKDAEKRSAAGVSYDFASRAALVLRVHYGDLQFVHAMASRDGEPAKTTQQNIMMWAEFTWKVATGEYKLGTRLASTVPGMEKLFSSGWSVQQLFTLGDPTYRSQIKDVAFGSLLHLLADSFSLAHVKRLESTGDVCKGMTDEYLEPGRIANFHSYAGQDHARHKDADTHDALDVHLATVGPNVVQVGKQLLDFYRQGKSWQEVSPFMQCIFTLDEGATDADAGNFK